MLAQPRSPLEHPNTLKRSGLGIEPLKGRTRAILGNRLDPVPLTTRDDIKLGHCGSMARRGYTVAEPFPMQQSAQDAARL